MNEKEVGEIRRRFRPEKSNITYIRGCYVNENREIISQFSQSLAITEQEEAEQILSCLKKTLSGVLGKICWTSLFPLSRWRTATSTGC